MEFPVRPPLTLRELVRLYVKAVRESYPGINVVSLAKLLGTAPTTLYRIIKGKEAIHTFGPRRDDEARDD